MNDGQFGEILDDGLPNSSIATEPNSVRETYNDGTTENRPKPLAATTRPLRLVKIQSTMRLQFWNVDVNRLPVDPNAKISLSHPGTEIHELDLLNDIHTFCVEVVETHKTQYYYIRWPKPGDKFLFLEKHQAAPQTFLDGRGDYNRFLFTRSVKIGAFILQSIDREKSIAVDGHSRCLVAENEPERAEKWEILPVRE